MRILFLAQRVPYPPNRGDKITTWRLIDRMRRRHDVNVVAFAHGEDDKKGAEGLRAMGIEVTTVDLNLKVKKLLALPRLATRLPMTLSVYGSSALQGAVDAVAPDCQLAYAYSSSMGAFLERHPRLKRVMHFAELDSDKWRQYGETTSWPMSWVYRREWRTLLGFERRLAHAFDENVFCTPLEQKIFEEQIPGASSIVLPNGVDLEHFRPAPDRAEHGHLVFTGVMDYFPNSDACIRFAREVLPKVRERFPETRFSIVGSSPTAEVQALGELPGVTVTGFVQETRDWLERGAIAVAPLRIARGIQNKVLEAMAMGLPVVGTRVATQGVDAEAGTHFLLADDVEAEIEAVCALLGDEERRRALGRAARTRMEERYDWEAVLGRLDELLDRLEP